MRRKSRQHIRSYNYLSIHATKPIGKSTVMVKLVLTLALLTMSSLCASRNEKSKTDFFHNSGCLNDSDCPVWGECKNNKCECKELNNCYSMKCEPETLQLSVVRCHCVTFDNETRELSLGKCIENCDNGYEKSEYLPLPLDINKLNQFMCEEKWNRTGRLCGKCLPGHSPLAYSYDLRCVKCPEGNRNVWKYILVAFGPLTIFYILVLLLRINVTSSHLHGYLIFSQFVSAPAFVRDVVSLMKHNPDLSVPIQVIGALYGMWNLDFLRAVKVTNICLDLSTLTVLSLDYAVAIYPLLLTAISYFLIELHYRNYKIVVILWKPFQCLFACLNKNWDSRTTIIDAYATFFILSYTKFFSVSVDLLIPVRVQSLNNDSVRWALYYDATLDYFGSEHLPYVILSVALLSIFIIAPTLLLLVYPFKWFHKILNCLKFNSRILTTLMDSFQGCYKDGTEPGTRDCRWFVAVPLIGRIMVLIAYALTLDSTLPALAACIVLVIIILTVAVQPYKVQFSNYLKIDVLFWGCLALFYTLAQSVDFDSLKSAQEMKYLHILIILVSIFPLLYMFCVTAYWLLKRTIRSFNLISRIKAWRRGYVSIETDFEASLPDRVNNPDYYKERTLQDPSCDTILPQTVGNTY